MDKVPDFIKEFHSFWLDLYLKAPTLAYFVIIMPSVIICYLIHTWGTIRKTERSIDQTVKANLQKSKKRKGGR
ncbi:hypothetical protein DVQ40_16110 [Yersinia enterocolitica]|nr:hypothetical protein [Yersinia enterocolitica]EKN6357051.1 hypothetical protein [Yersinia enterocolitica]